MHLILVLMITFVVATCQGEDGGAGPKGQQGDTGDVGQPGDNGTDGADGKDGAAGPEGPAGPTGQQGPQGPQGIPGMDGTDGETGGCTTYRDSEACFGSWLYYKLYLDCDDDEPIYLRSYWVKDPETCSPEGDDDD